MYGVLAMATLELARIHAEEELWKCQVSSSTPGIPEGQRGIVGF